MNSSPNANRDRRNLRTWRLLVVCATLLSPLQLIQSSAASTPMPTSVSINPGWNAIWFDFEPVYGAGHPREGHPMDASDLFAGTPITILARPDIPVGTAEFVAGGVSSGLRHDEWLVWRSVSELSTNTLTTIRGNRAYLIHATSAHLLNFEGVVSFFRPEWKPKSYNLIGFLFDQPVTFQDFFGSHAATHPINSIFRLNASGDWNPVSGNDLMNPNEAYWIYAEKSSTFMGPLAIRFPGSETNGQLEFGEGPGDIEVADPLGAGTTRIDLNRLEITTTNLDDVERHLSMSKVFTSNGPNNNSNLRLFHIIPQPGSLDYTIGSSGQINTSSHLSTTGPRTSETASIGAHRDWGAGSALQEDIYRLEVSIGVSGAYQYFWLPVTAGNANIDEQTLGSATPSAAGLWVGDVSIREVTSLTEDGRPLRPTSSPAPGRLLIHVDASGSAALLDHALLMRKKVAAPSVAPSRVIVVDEAKIPFFEGIETRNGTRVGRRFDTILYDLPRNLDPSAQPEMISEVAEALSINEGAVTEAEIVDYIDGQVSRPPLLTEAYHLKWSLEGGLNVGDILRTPDSAPLRMDPFHRSNPFRHAFHPRHGAGAAIQRTISLSIDHAHSEDVLSGQFEETITGLIAMPIITRGIINLQRVSNVPELQ